MNQLFQLIQTLTLTITGLLASINPQLAPMLTQPAGSSSASFASLSTPVPVDFPQPTLFYIKPEKNPATKSPVIDERRALGGEERGKPVPHDFGPIQSIATLPVSLSCPHTKVKDATFTFTRALLFKDFPDLNSQMYDDLHRAYPDIGTDAFLVLEGQASNMNSTEHLSNQFHAELYVKLKRPDSQYGGYGVSAGLPAYSTGYFSAIFPVRADEKQFTLVFCDFKHPTIVPLDFTAPTVSTIRGVYRFNQGVLESGI